MDGKLLKKTMLDAMDKAIADEIFNTDDRVQYSLLDAAAVEFVRETRCLTSTVTLATVTGQQGYDLPPDFIDLYMKNRQDKYFVKYYDGANYAFPVQTLFEQIFLDNVTDYWNAAASFAIIDKPTGLTTITGEVTHDGAQSAGQCILQDSTKHFLSTDLVYPRDIVHNTADGSDGLILSVTDNTRLVTALFSGGNNDWTDEDTYVIQRATSKQLYLSAPPASAGHTITVPYICMPSPVYSDYGFWRFKPASCRAICYEAAFLWQNRKGDYPGSDRHHALFTQEVKRICAETARAILQGGRYKNPY
jgi:hypothetical protein